MGSWMLKHAGHAIPTVAAVNVVNLTNAAQGHAACQQPLIAVPMATATGHVKRILTEPFGNL